MILDVLEDRVGNEEADRPTRRHPGAQIGAADAERRSIQPHQIRDRSLGGGVVDAGPIEHRNRDPVHHLVGSLPSRQPGCRIRTEDQREIVTGGDRVERVDRVGPPVAMDLTIIRLQGVTEFKFEDESKGERQSFNFFPDHLYTEIIIGLVVMIVLSAVATIFPATMGPPADPFSTPEIIKPEWFFYVAFRWLKLFTGTAAILSMGFIVFTMFAWPFIDAAIRRRTRFKEASVWIGIAGAFLLIALTVWEAVVKH